MNQIIIMNDFTVKNVLPSVNNEKANNSLAEQNEFDDKHIVRKLIYVEKNQRLQNDKPYSLLGMLIQKDSTG